MFLREGSVGIFEGAGGRWLVTARRLQWTCVVLVFLRSARPVLNDCIADKLSFPPLEQGEFEAMQQHQKACSKVDEGLATPIATSGHGYGCDNNCGYFSYSDGTEDEGCDAYPGSGFKPGGWNVVLNDDGHWCENAFKMGAVNGQPTQPLDDFGFLGTTQLGTKVPEDT